MSRNTSRGPMQRAFDQENKAINRIDEMKKWLDLLTPDELIAFRIAFCVDKPDAQHSREWAEKKIRSVARLKFVGRMAAVAFEDNEIGTCMQVISYFVPSAPQKIELDSKNTNLNLNKDIEDLSREELEEIAAKRFGKVPMIED